jgi:heptaprenyl diphosphate synthase
MAMKRGGTATKKIATLALLTALSLIMFIVENQFTPLPIPGARMGLANIFSLVALIMYSPLEAFAVVIVRTLLGAIFAGNVSMLLYSFTGGMVSMGLSALFLYIVYPKISIMAISILSACAHNMVQNIMFVFISASTLAFSYAPYLMLLGIVSGAIVGGVTMLIFKKVPLSVFEKVTYKKIVKDD